MLASPPMTRAGEAALLAPAALLGLVLFAAGGFPDQVPLRATAVVVAAAVWLALAFLGRTPLPRPGRSGLLAAGALVALVGWTTLSILWSATPERAWLETNRGIVYVSLAVLGALVAAVRPDPAAIARLVALVLGAVLAWALLQRAIPALGPDFAIAGQSHRLAGSIGYANGLAVVAAMAMPLALWLAGERRTQGAGLALAVLALVAAPLTLSRSGTVLVVAVAVAWIALAPRRIQALALAGAAVGLSLPALALGLGLEGVRSAGPHAARDGAVFGVALLAGLALAPVVAPRAASFRVEDERRVLRGAVAAGVALVLLGLAAGSFHAGGPVAFAQDRWHEFAAAKPGKETTSRFESVGSYRWSWWKEAGRGFAERPLGGHGAGSFALTHLHLRHNALSITRTPHSMPLQLLTELGLIGLLLAGLVVAGFVASVRTLVRRAGPATRGPLVALVLLVAVAVAHALVDLDWEILAIDAAPMFVAGTLVALSAPPVRLGRARPLAAAGTIVALLAALYSLGAPVLAARALDQALTDSLNAYDHANVAHIYDPLSVSALLAEARAAHARGDDGLAHERLVDATQLEPENPTPWTERGLFEWRVLGDPCRGYQSLNEAFTQDPAGAARGGPLDLTRRAVNKGACG